MHDVIQIFKNKREIDRAREVLSIYITSYIYLYFTFSQITIANKKSTYLHINFIICLLRFMTVIK